MKPGMAIEINKPRDLWLAKISGAQIRAEDLWLSIHSRLPERVGNIVRETTLLDGEVYPV